MTDIVLIDDDGVTAIFAYNTHATTVAQEVATASGIEDTLIWEWPELLDKAVGVCAVGLCSCCVPEFAQSLSRAGLLVEIDVPFASSAEPASSTKE